MKWPCNCQVLRVVTHERPHHVSIYSVLVCELIEGESGFIYQLYLFIHCASTLHAAIPMELACLEVVALKVEQSDILRISYNKVLVRKYMDVQLYVILSCPGLFLITQ